MKKEEAGLRIRVDDRLRGQFIAACRDKDQTAAQVIRSFMRRFVKANPVNREDQTSWNEEQR